MSQIEVNNISKSFIISHQSPDRYTSLRDVIDRKTRRIFSFPGFSSSPRAAKEEFWALRDVSFNVEQGERIGIIGRNGAGKSTLLKILSRITEPTSGEVRIRGRVASLLEVGTGFHPELTGRENIFLNGAILGMSRAEIKNKFDEIVDFAEVEKFLDTPVKRYSSGMYVRLAFSVAAHLDPEILIIDEVLAVGDAQFQKKCIGKIEEVSGKLGRTILFVSHNLAAVKSLCNSAVLLQSGFNIFSGNVQDGITKYISSIDESHSGSRYCRQDGASGKKIYVKELELSVHCKEGLADLEIALIIESLLEARIGINFKIKDIMGFPVAYGCSHVFFPYLITIRKGTNSLTLNTASLPLASGAYRIGVELVYPGTEFLDVVDDCIQFDVDQDKFSGRVPGISQAWGFGSVEIGFNKITYS